MGVEGCVWKGGVSREEPRGGSDHLTPHPETSLGVSVRREGGRGVSSMASVCARGSL